MDVGSHVFLGVFQFIVLLGGRFPIVPVLLLGAFPQDMSLFFAVEASSFLHEGGAFFNSHGINVHSIGVTSWSFEVPLPSSISGKGFFHWFPFQECGCFLAVHIILNGLFIPISNSSMRWS